MFRLTLLQCLLCIRIAVAHSFNETISAIPRLSNFTAFFNANYDVASLLLANSDTQPRTILVPNNEAFSNYELENGHPITDLSATELASLVYYHMLVGELTSSNFSRPEGLTAPSYLTEEKYNNRTAGPGLNSQYSNENAPDVNGQVVFISPPSPSDKKRNRKNMFLLRQLGSNSAKVKSGMDKTLTLTALDVPWDGGYIQEVDQFLTLPRKCSDTVRGVGLGSLDAAANRTNIWGQINTTPNLTCLAPNDQAFANAKHPERNLTTDQLKEALELHTIDEPLYTSFLQDGQTFLSLNKFLIRVTVKDDAIFFNDAKLLISNVITNNGVIHVLDKIMSPLNETDTTSTSSSSAGVSPTASPTSTNTAGGSTTSSTPSSTAGSNNGISNQNSGLGYACYSLWIAFMLNFM